MTKPNVAPNTPPAGAPVTTTANPSAAAAGSASSKPVAGGAAYGIIVGSYLFEDRAAAELTTVRNKTDLPSRVVPVTDGGTSMFRVVVGSFGSRAAAEARANELLRAGKLNEARVIALPRTAPASP